MRRAAFLAGCVTAAGLGLVFGGLGAAIKAGIRSTPWGTCETGGHVHPLDAEHHIDLTAYEAHERPFVSVGQRDGLAWFRTEVHPS